MDETLLITTRYLQGTNQPKVQTQREHGSYDYVAIKHLDIRLTGNPGMRGRLRFCVPLTLNFGDNANDNDNANYLHSNGGQPLTDRKAQATQRTSTG